MTEKVKKFVTSQNSLLLFIIIIVGVVATFMSNKFMSYSNIMQIFQQISVLGIVSMGMALVIISKGIDLSVSGIISLSAFVMCITVKGGTTPLQAALIAMGIGATCGLINGLIISFTNTAPLIITLGTQYIFFGFSLAISKGAFLSMQGILSSFANSKFIGIPMLVYVLILVLAITYFVLYWTRFGRRIVAVGGNEENAYLSGINVKLIKVAVYVISGLLAGFAAFCLVSRTDAVNTSVGSGYELRAIAACIMGGISFEGGIGSVTGAFLGVVLMGVIQNAMNIIG
ncbi:MAG: ABC transporter permease, partial [Clostridiaceae bacterium]|nr:ABC transporter permease [Clostridiaceae bacterium]